MTTGNLNFFNPFAPPTASGGQRKLVTKIPNQTAPMIIKLLGDMRSKQPYIEIDYYKHTVGPGKEYLHPSRKGVGLGEDLENKVYWEAWNAQKELKKNPNLNPEQEAELKRVTATLEVFKASRKAWLFFIEPNSPEIKAVRVSGTVIDQLWGRPAKNGRNAIPSLLEHMAKEGTSPFDIFTDRKNEGWIKIYKTGEGKFGTEYHVEPAKESVSVKDSEGNTIEGRRYVKYGLHETIVKQAVTVDDFPDVVANEKKYAFTEEETVAFVKSLGRVVPERFLKSDDAPPPAPASGLPAGVPSPVTAQAAPAAAPVMADLPF